MSCRAGCILVADCCLCSYCCCQTAVLSFSVLVDDHIYMAGLPCSFAQQPATRYEARGNTNLARYGICRLFISSTTCVVAAYDQYSSLQQRVYELCTHGITSSRHRSLQQICICVIAPLVYNLQRIGTSCRPLFLLMITFAPLFCSTMWHDMIYTASPLARGAWWHRTWHVIVFAQRES